MVSLTGEFRCKIFATMIEKEEADIQAVQVWRESTVYRLMFCIVRPFCRSRWMGDSDVVEELCRDRKVSGDQRICMAE